MYVKRAVIEKTKDLTRSAFDILLEIAKRQDLSGCARGINYADMMNWTSICKQSFYNGLRELESKGIVTYTHDDRGNYDIIILGNDFSYKGAFGEGNYIRLHRSVFHRRQFKELGAREKYLMLIMLMNNDSAGKRSFRKRTKELYQEYADMLHVTMRTIRQYLHSLRTFFSIGIKHGIYYITFKYAQYKGTETDRTGHTQQYVYLSHMIQTICRRNHIKASQMAMDDVEDLIEHQYKNIAADQDADLLAITEKCIEDSVRDIRKKVLSPPEIHRRIRIALNLL